MYLIMVEGGFSWIPWQLGEKCGRERGFLQAGKEDAPSSRYIIGSENDRLVFLSFTQLYIPVTYTDCTPCNKYSA